MSRTEKGMKNVAVTLIFYIISMLLAFFSRRIFIDHLGEDLIGLSTTILNILGFLNLAELGITSAIATALYKPLAKDDKGTINDLISIFNYLYHIIGYVILAGGFVLLFFVPTFFENASGVSNVEIYVTYIVFFSSMLVSYFISYKQLLLTADQRDYVIVTWTKTFNIVKVLCQIAALMLFDLGYMSWLVLELIFGVSYGFWINRKVKTTYPWLTHSFSTGRAVLRNYKELFVKIRQLIPHRLAGFVLAQTDNIVLFAVTSSLAIVTIYNNNIILIGSAVMIFTVSSNGLYAGVGSLIASGNKGNIKKLFNELTALYFFIGGVVSICIVLLAEPFMVLWLGEKFVVEPIIFYFILFNTAIAIFRLPVEMFLNGYMLYKDTWAPITEASLNLVVSIILGLKLGLLGIVLGTTISLTTIVCVWKPIFLFREGFKEPIRAYVLHVFKYIALMAVAFLLCRGVFNLDILSNATNFGEFFLNAAIILILSAITYGGLMYLFSNGMRHFVNRIFDIVKHKLTR